MHLAYRPDVDGLRAVAVGSVVLFHGHIPPFSGGFVGVDVFFVISGFLITSILARDIAADRFSLVDFYDRRIRRIFPALFLVLAVTTMLAALVLMPSQMVAYARALPASAFFFANLHFAQGMNYFGGGAEEMPLVHLWSLAVEEQFYIIFPLLLFALMRLGGRKLALGALLAIALVSLLFSQIEVSLRPQQAFYLLSTRAWELLAGALLALVPLARFQGRVGPRVATALGLAGIAGILVPVFVYSNDMGFPGIAALPPVLGAVLVILAGALAPNGPVARTLGLGGFVYVGRISYSLYLWHWPLLVLAALWKGSHLTYLQSGGLILVSVVLSALSLRYVEIPFRRVQSMGRARLMRFAAAASVMMAAVLVGVGFEGRGAGLWRNTAFGTAAEAADGNWNRFQMPCNNSYSDFDGTLTRAEDCTIGPRAGTGEYDAVVWGDSHAGAAFPGIAAALARAGLTTRLLAMDGCPPLVGGEALRYRLVSEGGRCAAFNKVVLDDLARSRPKLVVLAGRWSMWTRHGGPVWSVVSDEVPGGRDRTPESSRRVFAHMLERTFTLLEEMGLKVVVLGQVPEFTVAPPSCAARSEFYGRDTRRCLGADVAAAQSLVGEGNAMVLEAQKRHPRIAAFDPADVFCRDGRCPASDGKQFFYVDRDHLSQAGALRLDNDALRAVLAEALRHDPQASAALKGATPEAAAGH